MKKISLFFVVMTFLYVSASHAEGLQTLIEAGKNMGDVQKALSEETERYENVKGAIESGRLKKGITKDEVISQYGEPVVSNADSVKKREKLVYMPATSSFFKGPKIYLYFDSNNILDEISILQ